MNLSEAPFTPSKGQALRLAFFMGLKKEQQSAQVSALACICLMKAAFMASEKLTIFPQIIMKTTSYIALISLCACLFGAVSAAKGQSNVSPTGVPVISSYVPSSAPVGETVLANLTVDNITTGGAVTGEPRTVTHIHFRTSIGLPATAPVTYVAPRLIRFTVPAHAISGSTTLVVGTQLNSRVQPAYTVVPFTRRQAGIAVINRAVWTVGSIKTGTTELLPVGAAIPAGQARFIPRVLRSTQALPLDVTFSTAATVSQPARPLFTVRESVVLPTSGSTQVISLLKKVELDIEPFTATEILRMGSNGGRALWNIQFGGHYSRLEIFDDGRMTLLPALSFTAPAVSLTLDEASAEVTASYVRFRVRENGRLSGPALTLPTPFDVMATPQFGPVGASDSSTPMLLRRAQ